MEKVMSEDAEPLGGQSVDYAVRNTHCPTNVPIKRMFDDIRSTNNKLDIRNSRF